MRNALAAVALVAVCRLAFAASPIYVDQNATGANDGTSWENALTNLATAISWAGSLSAEVWVAQGTYVLTNSSGTQVGNNARLYGGFVGTETELAQRDWVANPTVITGTGGNILLQFNSNAHIDGFILRGGYTNSGAGAIQWNGTPLDCTITNCVFEDNVSTSSMYGAALGISGTGHVISNCVFRNHTRTAVNIAGSADFIDCIFENNVREPDAHSSSMAMYANGSSSSGYKTVNLVRCVFAGNQGKFAAVLTSYSGALVTATNCIFTGNSAEFDGGAVEVSQATFTAVNTVFHGNSARNGGAMYIMGSGCVVDIVNSIFLDNTASGSDNDIHDPYNAAVSVTYSLIEQADFSADTGVITGDPLFIDPDGADNISGTSDDDFRLQAGSPCIDAGFDGPLTPATDFLGLARHDDTGTPDTGAGGIAYVDMGAFEFQGTTEAERIRITSPGGGDMYLIGADMTVAWETTGSADDVRVMLSHDGGLSWTALDGGLAITNTGTQTFQVPGPPSVNCLVHVYNAVGGYPEGYSLVPFTIASYLTVSFDSPAEIAEDDATTVMGTVSIPQVLSFDVTVFLSSSDTGEATVPSSVTIPAGQISADIHVTPVNDGAIDGDQPVTITASAEAFVGASDTITVLDSASQTFLVTAPVDVSETAGTLTSAGSVSIPGTWGTDLVVSLASENEARLAVPATVTIPQGQTSVAFDLTVIDNGEIDGDETFAIEASASGWTTDSTLIEVLDDESQSITIALPASAGEDAGVFADAGTVTIPGTWDADLVVSLASDSARLTVPATVTIVAGDTSADFAITVVDNSVIDGDATVTITASASGWTGDAETIDVLDDESQTMALTLSQATVAEGSADSVTGTVTIPGTWATDLVVTLASDSARLTVPATVTIPQGETSADLAITVVDNSVIDGDATVTITASASGWTGDAETIDVLDDESQTMALTLSQATVAEGSADSVTGTVTIPGTWATDLVVTLASDSARLTVPASVTVTQGETSANFAVTVVDNLDIDGDATVTITASDSGWTGDAETIDVLDDDKVTSSGMWCAAGSGNAAAMLGALAFALLAWRRRRNASA